MAAITIGGVNLDLSQFEEGEPIPVGEQSRAFAGNLRNSIRNSKRQFTFEAANTTTTVWESLKTATANRAHVTVIGLVDEVLSADTITASIKVRASAVPGLPGYVNIQGSGEEV
jgi:hypothetical protein